MGLLLGTIKNTFSLIIVAALVFSSGFLSVMLYAKISGKYLNIWNKSDHFIAYAEKTDAPSATVKPVDVAKKSAHLTAPLVRQFPELPSGCEVSSLTMLLQFAGIGKNKMELVSELKFDPTPLKRAPDGSIAYWGNPNIGFVGDITGKTKGFGVYHTALMDLLLKNIPTGIDLTGKPFEALEKQIANGIPVVVWTTIDYMEPNWVVWDTSLGPIRTTFMEHAILMVGYDEQNVYVNDPLSGKSNVPINKAQFTHIWDLMSRQAISYK
jgi:uncharacterized protein YvpB